MGEMRNWLSPYNYCQNNPISRIDPTGALDEDGDGDKKPKGTNKKEEKKEETPKPPPPPTYIPKPKELPGFPDAEKDKPKGGRPRWKLPDGDIIEWDGRHGEVERYNPNGKHKGVWTPEGEPKKEPIPGRKIDPVDNPSPNPSTPNYVSPIQPENSQNIKKTVGVGTAVIILLEVLHALSPIL